MSETTDVTVDMLVTTTIHTDTMNILNVLMPDWVQGVADKYANEYSELTNTWNQLCKKVGAEKKAKILIVSYNYSPIIFNKKLGKRMGWINYVC